MAMRADAIGHGAARVLVVDNDPSFRLALRLWIEGLGVGADVTEAKGYWPAMGCLLVERYDLVIANAHLADGTGLKLRDYAHRHDTPCIVISGAPPSSRREEAAVVAKGPDARAAIEKVVTGEFLPVSPAAGRAAAARQTAARTPPTRPDTHPESGR